LELMGLARLMDALDANAVRAWLDVAAPGQIIYPDVASELAGWLADGAQAVSYTHLRAHETLVGIGGGGWWVGKRGGGGGGG
ncbi:hypothetical protein ACFX56_27475, partial [Aeromonas hydrophila]